MSNNDAFITPLTILESMADNLFSTLFKYGAYAPENYLTEAFVYLLKELLTRSPAAGLKIVNRLAHFPTADAFQNPADLRIHTQVSGENGYPDIQITDGEARLVSIEVKHDAPLHLGQLENYLHDLERTGMPAPAWFC